MSCCAFARLRRGSKECIDGLISTKCEVLSILLFKITKSETSLYSYSFASARKAIPISVVVSYLRLGKKYGINTLYSEGRERLVYEYPSTLTERDEVDDWTMIQDQPANTFSAVSIGREVSLLAILPLAYYTCLEHSINEILDGIEGEDGRLISLSIDDQRTCISALEKVLKAQHDHTYQWIHLKSDDLLSAGCQSPTSCSAKRLRIAYEMFLPTNKPMALWGWQNEWEEGICDSCNKLAKGMHNVGSEDMWDLLPSFFGLPDWEEILKDADHEVGRGVAFRTNTSMLSRIF